MFLDYFWATCLPVEEAWICALHFVGRFSIYILGEEGNGADSEGRGWGVKRTTLDRQRP